jgi:hypothetical protein
VLKERPAAGDVEGLGAARDRQHRQVRRDRVSRQGELGGVQVAPSGSELRVGRLAVGIRMDVRAAGQHHGVEVGEK